MVRNKCCYLLLPLTLLLYYHANTLVLTWLLKERKHRVQSRNLNCQQRESLESNEMGLRMRRGEPRERAIQHFLPGFNLWEHFHEPPALENPCEEPALRTSIVHGDKSRRGIFLHPRPCLLRKGHWQIPVRTPRAEGTQKLTAERTEGHSTSLVIREVRIKTTMR